MNVLFVCSGNSNTFKISPFIQDQGDSLKKIGININYFTIKGKGIWGYLKNIIPLRKYIKSHNYDVIHSHYSLCGFTVALTFSGVPHILSVMGADILGDYDEKGILKKSYYPVIWITKFTINFADHIIVKSENIKRKINKSRKVSVIPNGVDINKFCPLNKNEVRIKLNLSLTKKYLLFLGNPDDTQKNISLLKLALQFVKDKNIHILTPFPVPHDKIPLYLNAADVLVLTSYSEGSPNVIKEAMACNTPIVATDVGDVKWVIGNTEGCYITSYEPKDIAQKIETALKFVETKGKTNGRDRIIELGLDSETIAKKIKSVYEKVINER